MNGRIAFMMLPPRYTVEPLTKLLDVANRTLSPARLNKVSWPRNAELIAARTVILYGLGSWSCRRRSASAAAPFKSSRTISWTISSKLMR